MKGFSPRLWFLLPAAGLIAGCELLAGIEDISYSPDAGASASSGSGSSSGSVQTSGDGAQATGAIGTSGTTVQSGTDQQSGTTGQPDEDVVTPPMPDASSSGSMESTSGSSSGSNSVKDAGPDVTVEASSSVVDSSTADVNRVCVPGSAAGQLPFVVDSQYAPTGSFGTGTTTTSSSCTVARSSASAKGSCHAASYTVVTGGAFAGVYWQYSFDWGATGGYQIPPGATKITFSAMGKVGGEKVSFIAGYTGAPTAATPCTDSIRGNTNVVTLNSTWTVYSMTLTGGYPEGVLGAFGWEANAPGAAGTAITFYIDDIQYQ